MPPALLVHQVPAAVDPDLVALGEDGVRFFGEEVVVEVVLVLGTGREDGERRLRALRGGGPQGVAQGSHPERPERRAGRTSGVSARNRLMDIAPTGMWALSSITRYSHEPPPAGPPSTATRSKPICRAGTGPKRFAVEAS